MVGLHITRSLTHLFVQNEIHIQMVNEQLTLKFWSEKLRIGYNNHHDVWSIDENGDPHKMHSEVYNGRLTFRLRGESKRVSYNTFKKLISERNKTINQYCPF